MSALDDWIESEEKRQVAMRRIDALERSIQALITASVLAGVDGAKTLRDVRARALKVLGDAE